PSSRVAGIPPEVDAIVLRALAKDPNERFQDMAELAGAIGAVLPYVTTPGAPGSYPPAYHAGSTPPPGWSTRRGTRMHGTRRPGTPTTLGTSAGQVRGSMAPGKSRGWM